MRSIFNRRSVQLYCLGVGVFVAGYVFGILQSSGWCDGGGEQALTPPTPKHSAFLVVVVFTAPRNHDRRQAVRQSWMQTGKGLDVFHLFAVGLSSTEPWLLEELNRENREHGDLLILDSVRDTFSELSRKLREVLVWLDRNAEFEFLLKVDDDSFARLDAIYAHLLDYKKGVDGFSTHLLDHQKGVDGSSTHLSEQKKGKDGFSTHLLDHRKGLDGSSTHLLDHRKGVDGSSTHLSEQKKGEGLYWGFFDGQAKVKTAGKWREDEWFLCDRYLPYAKGGGYVLSRDLVHTLSGVSGHLSLYRNEDVSLGAWLAPFSVRRVHDPRFDTEFVPRGCSNAYLVTHKQSAAMMLAKYANLVVSGHLCASEYKTRNSYRYEWSVLPSQCCNKNDSRIP